MANIQLMRYQRDPRAIEAARRCYSQICKGMPRVVTQVEPGIVIQLMRQQSIFGLAESYIGIQRGFVDGTKSLIFFATLNRAGIGQ